MAPRNCPPHYLVSSCWSAQIIKMERVDMERDRELTISAYLTPFTRKVFLRAMLSRFTVDCLKLYITPWLCVPIIICIPRLCVTVNGPLPSRASRRIAGVGSEFGYQNSWRLWIDKLIFCLRKLVEKRRSETSHSGNAAEDDSTRVDLHSSRSGSSIKK